ncbi:MAG: hypothetical protein QW076_06390 [Candidatus Anstonellales archaeon]
MSELLIFKEEQLQKLQQLYETFREVRDEIALVFYDSFKKVYKRIYKTSDKMIAEIYLHKSKILLAKMTDYFLGILAEIRSNNQSNKIGYYWWKLRDLKFELAEVLIKMQILAGLKLLIANREKLVKYEKFVSNLGNILKQL